MTANKICIDASFAAKLLGLADLEITNKSWELIKGYSLVAPELIKYEVGNILLKYPSREIDRIIETFSLLDINFINIHELSYIYKMAEHYRISFYDAAYVAVVLQDSSVQKMYTFDQDFGKIGNEKIVVLS